MRKPLILCLLVFCLTVGLAAPASAQITLDFFTGPEGGTAQWTNFTPAPPGATDTQSIELTDPNDSPSTFAGVELEGVDDSAPATAPSFWYYTTQSGASGGSPRLVILFSDGGTMELGPDTLVANTWTLVDGSQPLWDSNGGTCGFLFNVSYETALACHSGATVTAVFIVNDSGWAFPEGGLTTLIDNITYEGETITDEAPATCDGLEPTITGSGRIVGTGDDDVIIGSEGPDRIIGGGGDDVICGLGGADVILGEAGRDRIFGGPGGDTLVGGADADELFGQGGPDILRGEGGNDDLNGGAGIDRCNGGGGNNTLVNCEPGGETPV